MSKEWLISPVWPEREQAASDWQVTPLIAQILHNRQIETLEQARTFLSPKLSMMHEPATLPGTEEASRIIAQAVGDQKKIVVYGDYDVDGITGAAILWHLLSLSGAKVEVYVPHRLEEGYGLNSNALKKIRDDGGELVITVDCGITSSEPAKIAGEIGLDLIITDHHSVQEELPVCAQIVHPSAQGDSPNQNLCGAGVAFKLAWAVAQRLSPGNKVTPEFREFLLNATGLAALGTIADVVSLQGENRLIARHGLAGLPQSTIAGVQALIDSTGLRGETIDSYAVGFKLAPRINAAGRMGHARLAVELLTRADHNRAREIATYLEGQNKDRQSLERKIFQQAKELVYHHQMNRDNCRAIVLAQENWHAGVIGIVASRLVEEFHRPAVMISLANDQGQGSARSIRHFELNTALEHCSDYLLSHGGHHMAAGLSVAADRIAEFRQAFVEYANNRLTAKDLIPGIKLDAQAPLADLDDFTVRTILNLGPFGAGNPKPRLASDWLDLQGNPRCVGANQDHLQFALREGPVVRKAIGFGLGKHLQELRDHRRCRVAFEPIINSWMGRESLELQINDIRFPTKP